MKKGSESKEARSNISQTVMGLIRSKGLAEEAGKDAAEVLVPIVKRMFPGSKFKLSHVYWYLARYRRQKRNHKAVDHLVEMKPAKRR